MNFRIDFIGAGILLSIIFASRIIGVIRTVHSIKSHAQALRLARDTAIQKGEDSVHYQQAYTMLYNLQKERLITIKKSFWGVLIGKIATKKYYEIP